MLWSENCFNNARVLDEMADKSEHDGDMKSAKSSRTLANGNRCMAYQALFMKNDTECKPLQK